MTTWTSAVRPPTPRPWTTRAPISTSMLGANAATSEPSDVDHQRQLDQQLLAEEVGQLAPDRGARGHRQHGRDDDPGVAGLAAVQVADDRAAARSTTTVLDSIATNIASRRPLRASRIWRWVIWPDSSAETGATGRVTPGTRKLDSRSVEGCQRQLYSRIVAPRQPNLACVQRAAPNGHGPATVGGRAAAAGNAATRRRRAPGGARSGGRDDRIACGSGDCLGFTSSLPGRLPPRCC